MINIFPTNYQIKKIIFISKISILMFFLVFFGGNVIFAIFGDSTTVPESAYTLEDGKPIFTDHNEYLKFIKNYPYDAGVKLRTYKLSKRETLWHVTQRYNISLNTIIGANPFITDLKKTEGMEIILPSENGVLFPFDDITDVWDMKDKLNYTKKIGGDYKPSFFEIISNDDIRLVFFKGSTPVFVNNKIRRLYECRQIFQKPLEGYYTSLYGERVHPFFNHPAFHNGIDIQGRTGRSIKPTKDGMVIFSGRRNGFGKVMIVQHKEGYTTLYAHCSKLISKVGDWVTKDKTIALVGSTGRSTGPHLHFSVMRHGKILNPLLFIW